jgi:transmembrane sensor
MEFDKMDIADFLADESFINYCKETSPEDTARWEQYINDNPNYLAKVENAKAIFVELFNALATADIDEQEMGLKSKLNKLNKAVVVEFDKVQRKSKSVISLFIKIASAAAIIVFAIFITTKFINPLKTETLKSFVANYGEKKNFQLPDGSIVMLNAGSKINIKENYGVYSRDIYLEGEAFFDVKHNAELPFIVHTRAMDIMALGTAFNVKAYPGEKLTETSLVRGLVEVTFNEDKGRKVLLHPNQKVQYGTSARSANARKPGNVTPNNKLIINESEVQNITKTDNGDIVETAWKENKLIFEDETFADIAISLERWYGVKIAFADDTIQQYRFTGIFEKEKLETLFSILKETKNFNYVITSGDTLKINISR